MSTLSRRTVLAGGAAGAATLFVESGGAVHALPARGPQILEPSRIPKYRSPLLVPPAMPPTSVGAVDRYVIGVRRLRQQVLPAGMPTTTVFAYGSESVGGTHNSPALTIEARVGHPVEVTWVNGLEGRSGRYLPHLLPVDPTLHWANPGGGEEHRDGHGMFDETPGPYRGPVPLVVHLHGGHTRPGERRVPGGVVPARLEQHPGRVRPGRVAPRGDGGVLRGPPRCRLGARDGAGPLRQRPGRGHLVVPRPRPRHHPPQRLRGTGGVLPPARGRARPPARSAAGDRARRRGGPRDPPGDPGPGVHPRR